MRSKLAYGFILAAAASCLTGCSYFRPTGPCFGTGCPARTVGQSGQYKLGQGPKSATASAAPQTPPPGTLAPNASAAPNPTGAQNAAPAQNLAPAQNAPAQQPAPSSAASRLLAKLPFVGRRSVN
jgi:hypothetical protein